MQLLRNFQVLKFVLHLYLLECKFPFDRMVRHWIQLRHRWGWKSVRRSGMGRTRYAHICLELKVVWNCLCGKFHVCCTKRENAARCQKTDHLRNNEGKCAEFITTADCR